MLKNKIISVICGLCFFCTTYALELDWRSIRFNSTNYSRIAVDGGAALYTLPSQETLKFKIQFVFPNSLFSMPEANMTALDAMTDMLILGGFGGKNYEQIQKELAQNGINLNTSLNTLGEVVVSCDALTEDFQRVLTIVNNLILTPKFDKNALILWKAQAKSQFVNFSNANTLGKQMLFINVEAARLAFGPEHYFATTLLRASPKYTQAVTMQKIQALYQQVLNRNGLNVLLSGAYPATAQADMMRMIAKIPVKNTVLLTWLPGRLQSQALRAPISHDFDTAKHSGTGATLRKIKSALIHKKDMTQSQVSLRFYYPSLGELNSIEKAQITILTEIFSSTGGVVGNDRFSKAMRADSGLSYSPRATFKVDIISPNTNLSMFVMNFQSPNEKIFEAVTLAKKTWDNFIANGISAHELTRTRSSIMNSMLANELTVFDKSDLFFSKILHGKIPSVNPIQEALESLEAQKNIDKINAFLKTKLALNSVGVLVIMGNPQNDQIAKLKSLSALDFVETKEVNSLL